MSKVKAVGQMEAWGMYLFSDGGWHVTHKCKKKKHSKFFDKPVWGDKFYSKFAKQLIHWNNEPRCIRCWEAIPSLVLLMMQMRDADSINATLKVIPLGRNI